MSVLTLNPDIFLSRSSPVLQREYSRRSDRGNICGLKNILIRFIRANSVRMRIRVDVIIFALRKKKLNPATSGRGLKDK